MRTIDSTRLTHEQNYKGLNSLVHAAKTTYYDLVVLWEEARDRKDYTLSDELRGILKNLEWRLLYWGELEEEHTIFNKDKL